MEKMIQRMLLTTMMVLAASMAHATTFSGETLGIWTNPIYDSNDYVRIYNNDAGSNSDFYFGRDYYCSYSSRFRFDGVGSDGDADWVGQDDGTRFLIGEFAYRNGVNPSYSVDGVRGVDLNISMEIVDPLALMVNSFDFDFGIDTTHNLTGNPYTDRDFVTLTYSSLSETFMYNSEEYTLDILGFSSDKGETFRTDFTTNENCTTYAGLYASITKNSQAVPEPGSMLLLGSGLMGLLRFRKRIGF